ncbi:MAG: hypothetical protein K2G62_03230 [Oscillospiraceae bacterium]|nr:hypothetical protein [Oscillospiraceae bacterium]
MEYIIIIAASSVCLSWMVTSIKLKQINKMLDEHMNNMYEIHDSFLRRFNQQINNKEGAEHEFKNISE